MQQVKGGDGMGVIILVHLYSRIAFLVGPPILSDRREKCADFPGDMLVNDIHILLRFRLILRTISGMLL